MSMERLPFEHRPRNSIANNLDRINELVDWVNLDTHLYASASGERVTVADASSVKGLTVDGRSVQDGTPTPDAPVPVQVVEGGNLQPWPTSGNYSSGGVSIAYGTNGDTIIIDSGTTANVWALPGNERLNHLVHLMPGTYIVTCPGNLRLMVLSYDGGTWTNIASNTRSPYTLTLLEASDILCMYSVLNGTGAGTYEGWVQLEAGTTATPYTPYGSIGIVVGDTATSIDLQGNTLASLPDGTRDELHIDSAGRVWIEKRTGRILTPTDVSSVNNLTQVTGGARWNIDVNGLTSEEIPNGSTNGFCSHTPFSRTLALGSLGSHVFTFGGKIYYIVEGDFTASTAVTWVNSHQMTIIYPLATTQTIDLGYIDPPAIPSGSVVTISASLTPTIHLEWWIDDGITEVVNDLIAYIDYKTEG
jgi:hypothetical protein